MPKPSTKLPPFSDGDGRLTAWAASIAQRYARASLVNQKSTTDRIRKFVASSGPAADDLAHVLDDVERDRSLAQFLAE